MTSLLAVALGACLGASLGSFLNVVLSRVPRGESVISPASRCEGCGRGLAWWENVPVLSWIALRGRCRTCHARIGWRHAVVEAAAGLAGAALAARLAGGDAARG